MLIKTLPVGQLETNCYIVTNEATLECVVIDPGDESITVLEYMESNRLKCKAVLLTHGHFDHTGACDAVSEETGAPVYMNEADDKKNGKDMHLVYTLPENGKYYGDGDVIDAAGMQFEVLATPGHTAGSVTLKVNDVLFTGDTLFRGSCGRTDMKTGDPAAMNESLRKLCSLEGEFEVYPGHMDSTSLVRERNFNFYCRKAMQK